jgi:hypothetical protein
METIIIFILYFVLVSVLHWSVNKPKKPSVWFMVRDDLSSLEEFQCAFKGNKLKGKTINVMVSEDVIKGDAVVFGKRTWKERLFTLPWRPMQKQKVSKPLQKILKPIAQMPGVVSVRVYNND